MFPFYLSRQSTLGACLCNQFSQKKYRSSMEMWFFMCLVRRKSVETLFCHCQNFPSKPGILLPIGGVRLLFPQKKSPPLYFSFLNLITQRNWTRRNPICDRPSSSSLSISTGWNHNFPATKKIGDTSLMIFRQLNPSIPGNDQNRRSAPSLCSDPISLSLWGRPHLSLQRWCREVLCLSPRRCFLL